jgi:regulator of sigma E protease
MAIAAAGPAFNFLFAVAAFWLMFVVGKADYLPIVDAPTGVAAEAGMQAGDRITAIDGMPVRAWSDTLQKLGESAVGRYDARVDVTTGAGTSATRTFAFSDLSPSVGEDQLFTAIGLSLQAREREAVIAHLGENMPAAAAGLAVGDRILRINGHAISDFSDIERLIPEQAAIDAQLRLVVERAGEQREFVIRASEIAGADGQPRYVIGIGAPAPAHDAILKYGPLEAIPQAFAKTWDVTRSSLGMLKMLIVGRASLENLSGPITIARFANGSAQLGLAWFLNFLAIISLSLAIINLLPIPILDGGHLLYYLIELVKGSPVSERAQIFGQYAGLMMLVALMGLAFYNDILRLLT